VALLLLFVFVRIRTIPNRGGRRTVEDVKVYGLCLGRLKHQIGLAREREKANASQRILLESYCYSDPADIIDILELYDIEDRSLASLMGKLGDLAYTASVLMRETLTFGIDENGVFGLYLLLDRQGSPLPEPDEAGTSVLSRT